MILSENDLSQLSRLATEAAQKAGQFITNHTNHNLKINCKKAGNNLASQIVTEVDLKSQEIILSLLNPTLQQYDLGLLTEETTDNLSRLHKDYFWCIDPLDGTLPFTESRTGYAVSIALISRAGIPQMGVVYSPLKKDLYQATKGQGSLLNGKPWILPIKNSKQKFTFITDRGFLKDKRYQKFINQLTIVIKEAGYQQLKIIPHGGAVMNAIWVLEHSPAAYCKLPKIELGGGSLWDFAATACIIEETKAIISDIKGNPLDLNPANSTFMNQHGVLYASAEIWSKKIQEILKPV